MLTEIIWVAVASSILTVLLIWFFAYTYSYLKKKHAGKSYIRKLTYRGLLSDLKTGEKRL